MPNKPLHRSRDRADLDARDVSGCGSMNGNVIAERLSVTQDDAIKLAATYVGTLAAESETSLTLFRDGMETHDFGWVLFYGSSDPKNSVAGNGPLFVDKRTGSVFPTGTAYSLSTYLDNFRERGNPNSFASQTARLEHFTDDSRRIEIILLLRDLGRLSLADAKRYLENCVDGLQPTIEFDSLETATKFVHESARLGLIVTRGTKLR